MRRREKKTGEASERRKLKDGRRKKVDRKKRQHEKRYVEGGKSSENGKPDLRVVRWRGDKVSGEKDEN